MRKLASLAVAVALLGACGGEVADPEALVAKFTLTTRPDFDPLKGLFAKECVDHYGKPSDCTPYPNDLECDVLNVTVKGDARTYAECSVAGKITRRGYMGLLEGVPFVCQTDADMSCHVCADLYGNAALDTCNRARPMWRSPNMGSGWQNNLPAGSGFIAEQPTTPPGSGTTTPTTPTTPPGNGTTSPTTPTAPQPTPTAPGGNACDWQNALDLYAGELNKLLAHDGLNFTWTPDKSKFAKPDGTILQGNVNASCEKFASDIKDLLHKCPKPQADGSCNYCWQTGGCKTCKCYRINVTALEKSCKAIPTTCDHGSWSAALIMSYGVATKWLFSPSYGNFYGKVDVPSGEVPKFPKCEGSPLVLDLVGDGIEPTSNARGVKFDLLGVGAIKTSWVKGDDALLALDRDGNGRIDSGAELFGEAGGNADGFQALGKLDSNSDGLIDAKDARFAELRLWTDLNGDGVSQAGELLPLAQKVRSLGLGSTVNPAAVDSFGNDLRLQGSFTRADGSRGLMVDVFFVGR